MVSKDTTFPNVQIVKSKPLWLNIRDDKRKNMLFLAYIAKLTYELLPLLKKKLDCNAVC